MNFASAPPFASIDQIICGEIRLMLKDHKFSIRHFQGQSGDNSLGESGANIGALDFTPQSFQLFDCQPTLFNPRDPAGV
jgi:hypothetical protein